MYRKYKKLHKKKESKNESIARWEQWKLFWQEEEWCLNGKSGDYIVYDTNRTITSGVFITNWFVFLSF